MVLDNVREPLPGDSVIFGSAGEIMRDVVGRRADGNAYSCRYRAKKDGVKSIA